VRQATIGRVLEGPRIDGATGSPELQPLAGNAAHEVDALPIERLALVERPLLAHVDRVQALGVRGRPVRPALAIQTAHHPGDVAGRGYELQGGGRSPEGIRHPERRMPDGDVAQGTAG